jgi:hypothetical protein
LDKAKAALIVPIHDFAFMPHERPNHGKLSACQHPAAMVSCLLSAGQARIRKN